MAHDTARVDARDVLPLYVCPRASRQSQPASQNAKKKFKGWVWVHHIFFGWAVKISHHYFNLHLPNAKCASCRKSQLNLFFGWYRAPHRRRRMPLLTIERNKGIFSRLGYWDCQKPSAFCQLPWRLNTELIFHPQLRDHISADGADASMSQ